jgi:hypothetical protein
MTSAPPPSTGGNPKVVVPQSQQQAQDTVLNYLKRTLQGLPPGTTLDATRYGGASVTASCDDSPTGPGKPPMDFATTGDLKLPNGTDAEAAIAQAGELWKSWGWNVQERDGFRKPNRFGDAPDGYRLRIVAAYPPGSPPVVNAVSPCFPGDLARNDIPCPTVLQA